MHPSELHLLFLESRKPAHGVLLVNTGRREELGSAEVLRRQGKERFPERGGRIDAHVSHSAFWHVIPEQTGAMAAEEEWKRGQLGQSRQQGQWTTVVEILLHSVPTLSDNECQACVLTLLS